MAHVFISYAHVDGDFAAALIRQIENAGFKSWIDSEQLRAGEDWRDAIDDGVRNAFALIVIMTPEARASEYVTYEWACAWGAGVQVIPVLLRPTHLHPRLAAFQYLDFSELTKRPWDKLVEELRRAEQKYSPNSVHVSRDAPPAVKKAVTALDSHNPRSREAAIETLGRMNHSAAFEALVGALQHPTKDVRLMAAIILGGSAPQSEHAIIKPLLLEALDYFNDDVDRQQSAVYALGEFRDIAAAVPKLWDIFYSYYGSNYKDSDAIELGEAAILVLKQIGGPAVISRLVKVLDDSRNELVRYEAARVLGEIGDTAVVQTLAKALRDKDGNVAYQAAKALERIGTPEALAAVEQWKRDQGGQQA